MFANKNRSNMNSYVTGEIIRQFREKENLTQTQLAEKLSVSNKTISKWENGKGLPDISLLDSLAKALNVSLIELMSGYTVSNKNVSANMRRGLWYVCPVCKNVVHTMGEAVISCCGITLPKLEAEEEDEEHTINIERIEDEYVVTMNHPMDKDHLICFMAYVTDSKLRVEKLYPESEALCRFRICGHGQIYAYCNHHGLYSKRI